VCLPSIPPSAPLPRIHLPRALRRLDWERFTDPVDLENRLQYDTTESLAYAVHGHWYRRDDDDVGRYGTWWCLLSELYGAFPEEVVAELLHDYDNIETEARDTLRAAAREEREARRETQRAARDAAEEEG